MLRNSSSPRFICQLVFLFLFTYTQTIQADDIKAKQFRVVLHLHSSVSGSDELSFRELTDLAIANSVDVLIMTDYFQQKVRLVFDSNLPAIQWPYERDSLKRFGIGPYDSMINQSNESQNKVLFIRGAEVTPSYWWSGSLFKNNLMVHDLQKNLLVFGLEKLSLEHLPTQENNSNIKFPLNKNKSDFSAQRVIEFVAQRNGVSIWSTPDEVFGANFKIGPVHFHTSSYSRALLETDGYSGVGIFPDGYSETGRVGGLWDQLLYRYTQNRRKTPVWAFSEGVIHRRTANENFGKWDNIVFAESLTEQAILKALRAGQFYIRKNKGEDLFIQDFFIDNAENAELFRMGQTMRIQEKVVIRTSIGFDSKVNHSSVVLKIIRNGKIVHESLLERSESQFVWEDLKTFEDGESGFYRIQIESSSGSILLSNPIFYSRLD